MSADEERFDEWPTREERLHPLAELFPAADEYVVVDDVDLSAVDGWTHYYAWTATTPSRTTRKSASMCLSRRSSIVSAPTDWLVAAPRPVPGAW